MSVDYSVHEQGGIGKCRENFENNFEVLREISVTFDQESVNFIIGRSGAGKTTLIKILLGLTSPTKGKGFL